MILKTIGVPKYLIIFNTYLIFLQLYIEQII